ncbi:MAG TPA: helix-turn-helix transcriptional regulator [Humibacter sp.]|jgi:transcriptional regulator with XRE-family HTH domain|nr:helix-turn-helix transcriptional regulator [Humibacter sp.]
MPDNRWPGSVELGERIAKARERAAISRQELANLANTDVSNLSRIENGFGNPGFYTLVRIAASLGVDPADLVKGIGVDMIPSAAEVLTVREWAAARRAELRKKPRRNG